MKAVGSTQEDSHVVSLRECALHMPKKEKNGFGLVLDNLLGTDSW